MKKLTLKETFEYEGKKYKDIEFDFDSLTGQNFIEMETELEDEGKTVLTPELSSRFKLKMCEKASGISEDVFLALPLKEFRRAIAAAGNFLFDGGFFGETPENG